jgi:hypothetical protein
MPPFAKSPMQMRREAEQRRNPAPTLESLKSGGRKPLRHREVR